VNRRFTAFAWGTLAYTVFVILWGAFVRATGSGAGCGDHWPLCNGEVVPRTPTMETIVEFGHRLTSGLALILVLVMFIWARRAYPKGSLVRKGAAWSLGFMVLEALIGAALVLLELVAYNVSVARGWWMAAHLVNTFFLVGVMTLTAWWAQGGPAFRFRGSGMLGASIVTMLIGTGFLSASGAVAALGDTLTIGGGIDPASDPIVATLVGLRIFHPLIACVVLLLVGWAAWEAWQRPTGSFVDRLGVWIVGAFLVQMGIGVVNVWLMAPVWIQIVHLFVTNLIWIAMIVFCANALAATSKRVAPAREAVVAG
jgi:cytochrome c oxidase assembly protein subunit 15